MVVGMIEFENFVATSSSTLLTLIESCGFRPQASVLTVNPALSVP